MKHRPGEVEGIAGWKSRVLGEFLRHSCPVEAGCKREGAGSSGKSSLQEAAPLVAVEEWERVKLVSAGPEDAPAHTQGLGFAAFVSFLCMGSCSAMHCRVYSAVCTVLSAQCCVHSWMSNVGAQCCVHSAVCMVLDV